MVCDGRGLAAEGVWAFFLSSMKKPPECSELESNMLCLTPVLEVPPSCQVETREETGTPAGKMVLSLRPRERAWSGVVAAKAGDGLAGPGERVTVGSEVK